MVFPRSFKFQSDSINTLAASETVMADTDFKFQSDSINTPILRHTS